MAGDFNDDGALDLWSPANGGRVLLNQTHRYNLPPNTPDDLRAFTVGSEIYFLWNHAADPNQTAALTYNLRVGTSPGANDVVASLSLADGARLVAAPGNSASTPSACSRCRAAISPSRGPTVFTGPLRQWTIRFTASLWAPEQTVLVTLPPNEPPTVTGLNNLVMD